MMGVAMYEMFSNSTILIKAFLFLIKLNKPPVQSVPNKDLIFDLIGPLIFLLLLLLHSIISATT